MRQLYKLNRNKILAMIGDEIRNLGFVGVADDKGNAGESGEFLRSALRVASGDENFGSWISGVDLADCVASLRVCGRSDSTSIDDDKFRAVW